MKKMITRRNFLAAAGVVAAAGVLTACGGSSSSTAASGSAAGSAAGSTASGETIKVGVMGPLSGNVSVYGQAVVNGASLYLKQVNADGGINGKQIEILTEDEQGNWQVVYYADAVRQETADDSMLSVIPVAS
mgnify:CR=1 FL=1